LRLNELGFEMRATRHGRLAYIRGLGVGRTPKCEEFGRGGGRFHREVSGSSTSWRWRTPLTSGPRVAVT